MLGLTWTLRLLQQVCMVVVAVLIALRMGWRRAAAYGTRRSAWHALITVCLFTVLAVIGTHSGIVVNTDRGAVGEWPAVLPTRLADNGAVINFRDLFVIVAGLIGGGMVDKLRVVIVEDEPLSRAELGDLLSQYPDIEVVGEASDAVEGWKQMEAHAPDLVFVDIRMEGETSGLDLARKINRIRVPPRLIFVTAYLEHALASHSYHPVHFLTKPLEDAKLVEALDWVRVRRAVSSSPTTPRSCSTRISRGLP